VTGDLQGVLVLRLCMILASEYKMNES